VNICDQYDALRSRRPYKPALGHEEALTIITKGDGRTEPGHFDPRVHEAFLGISRRMRELYEEPPVHDAAAREAVGK
jgi:putative two-component system response regulator